MRGDGLQCSLGTHTHSGTGSPVWQACDTDCPQHVLGDLTCTLGACVTSARCRHPQRCVDMHADTMSPTLMVGTDGRRSQLVYVELTGDLRGRHEVLTPPSKYGDTNCTDTPQGLGTGMV